MYFCKSCGASLEDDAKFCNVCGTARQTDTQPVEGEVNEAPKSAEPASQAYSYAPANDFQAAPVQTEQKENGWAGITSLICGIVGFLCCFTIIPGALAIVFGTMGLKTTKKGMAIAGLILGVIGVLLGIIILAFYASNWDQLVEEYQRQMQQYSNR